MATRKATKTNKVPDHKAETPFVVGGLYLEVLPAGWRAGRLLNAGRVGNGTVSGEIHFPSTTPLRVTPGTPPFSRMVHLGAEADIELIEAVVEAVKAEEEG